MQDKSILQYFWPSFNLQVLLYIPTIDNKIKYTNNLLRIFLNDNTVYIGQFSKFAMKLKKKFLTENWFLNRAFFQGRSGKGKQIKF